MSILLSADPFRVKETIKQGHVLFKKRTERENKKESSARGFNRAVSTPFIFSFFLYKTYSLIYFTALELILEIWVCKIWPMLDRSGSPHPIYKGLHVQYQSFQLVIFFSLDHPLPASCSSWQLIPFNAMECQISLQKPFCGLLITEDWLMYLQLTGKMGTDGGQWESTSAVINSLHQAQTASAHHEIPDLSLGIKIKHSS